MSSDPAASTSVLPADEVPAYSTTVYLDSENVFHWADRDPEGTKRDKPKPYRDRQGSLSNAYRAEFGVDYPEDEDLTETDLMRLGPAVFHAFRAWIKETFGDVDLRSYGKRNDPASVMLRGLADRGHWVHVDVSHDKKAADRALVKDLEDRSRRLQTQVFVIATSDNDDVLTWTRLVAAAASQHEYRVVLGPTLLSDDQVRKHGLTYDGAISELFGRIVRERKGRPSSFPLLTSTKRSLDDRRRRQRLASGPTREALRGTREARMFGDILVNRANVLADIPAMESHRAREIWEPWKQIWLDAWAKAFPEHAGVPTYAAPDEVTRLLGRCQRRIPLEAVARVVHHAIAAKGGADRATLEGHLWTHWEERLGQLPPERGHL